nr:aspartyl protease family protein 1 [Quercus suber]
MEFSAIFDSSTSFTQLRDPVYTFISKIFNSQVTEKRHSSNSQIPFEYCHDLRSSTSSSSSLHDSNSNTPPISPLHSPATSPSSPSHTLAASPALVIHPEAIASSSHSSKLKAFTYALMILFVSFFTIV